ncbi:MAG: hypothetical protein LBG70_03595 [Bifidobacteriaceae bacterium]|jgi:hypothetical protein|nr:hypothetical protein [Bifidobacteriaceae bacterium]
MVEVPDWSKRREHVESRSSRGCSTDVDVLTTWADQAYLNEWAVRFDPDYASRTGRSVRTISWSDSAGFIVTVITVRDDTGHLWGATAFKANMKDQSYYTEGRHGVHE